MALLPRIPKAGYGGMPSKNWLNRNLKLFLFTTKASLKFRLAFVFLQKLEKRIFKFGKRQLTIVVGNNYDVSKPDASFIT